MQKKLLQWDDLITQEKLKASLEANHISITSTDTVLGFLAPLTEIGLTSINSIKQARSDKPCLILVASPEKLDYFVDRNSLNRKVTALIKQCWPGPLTIIFKAKKDLASYLVAKDGTIAIRCPEHKGLLKLLEYFDGLFSSSANISTQEVFKTIDQITPDIISNIDYVVIDQDYATQSSLSSTIIDLSGPDIKIVRQGAFPEKQLMKILE